MGKTADLRISCEFQKCLFPNNSLSLKVMGLVIFVGKPPEIGKTENLFVSNTVLWELIRHQSLITNM